MGIEPFVSSTLRSGESYIVGLKFQVALQERSEGISKLSSGAPSNTGHVQHTSYLTISR